MLIPAKYTTMYTILLVFTFLAFSLGRTDAKGQSLTACLNRTLKSGEFSFFPNGTLYVESLGATLTDSYFVVDDSVIICVPKYEDRNTPVTCSIRTNAFIPIITLVLELRFICFKMNLRHLLFNNFFLLCVALSGLGASFLLTDWYEVHEIPYSYTVSTFGNFFVVVISSWLSILSSEVFILDGAVLQNVKKTKGVLEVTNFEVLWRRVSLMFIEFVASIELFHLVVESLFSNFEGFSWETGKNPSPFVFAGSVVTLFIFNLASFIMGKTLNRKRENPYLGNQKCQLALEKNYIFFFLLSAVSSGSWFMSAAAYWFANPALKELSAIVFFLELLFTYVYYHASSN